MVVRHRAGWTVPVLLRWPTFGWAAWRPSAFQSLVALALPVLAGGLCYHPTLVEGASMEPTLHTGQLVWTDRAYYWRHAPQAGEVIVFRHGGETYIKRVYGLPGQTLYWFVNHEELVRPIRAADVEALQRRWRGPSHPVSIRVPEGHVFVLGDSPTCSEDSRHFGDIPIRDRLGRARLPVDVRRLLALEFTSPPLPHRPRAAAPSALALAGAEGE